MKFTILGKTALEIGTASIPLGARKQRAVLALLLLHVRRPVPVEMLVGVLWPGRTRDEVRGNVHAQVSRIRRALENSGLGRAVVNDGDAYRLDIDKDMVDYHHFCALADSGRAAIAVGDHSTGKARLREAIELWGGIPLADVPGDWAEQRRSAMESNDLLHAYQALFQAEVQLREYTEVLRELVPLMEERYPHDDMLAFQRMKAMEGLGDRIGAATFYVRHRQRLIHEFGSEPSTELVQFHTQLLALDKTGERTAEAAAPVSVFPRATSFTGRAGLLRRLDGFLGLPGTSPVVALHGMPGVGKTQLAVHWGHRNRAAFPDGRVLLDMRGYGPDEPLTADNAISLLLDRLGVPIEQIPAAPERRPAVLSRVLADRRILLVADNVRDADHVRGLLDAVPDCFVLLTSRDRLHSLTISAGVTAISVPGLTTAESVELLRSTIEDRRTEDEPGLLEIAGLSGGLPLALKIIGQHVADRPLETLSELAGQLRAQRDLFADDTDDDFFTLSAAFSWSYRALTPETARIFRLIGLHPGTRVSNETAAALAHITPEQAMKHLRQLTRANLVDLDVAGAYRLHDVTRAYAHQCAMQAELSADRRDAIIRLLTFYVETSSAVSSRLSPQSPEVPALEIAGVVAPLAFPTDQAALDWCAHERGNVVAATKLAAAKGLHEHAWRIPAALQEALERSGFYDDMVTCHELALESAALSTDLEAEPGTRNNLGLMYVRVGRLDEALEQFQASLERSQAIGHEPCEAAARYHIGVVLFERGDEHAALHHYQSSLAINRRLGGVEGEAFALHRIGMAHHRLNDFAEALQAYQEALRIRVSIGHTRGQGATLTELAALHQQMAEPEIALEYCLSALRAHQSTSDRVETCHAMQVRAAIEFDLGDFPAAHEHAEQAIALACEVHESATQVKAMHLLGHVLIALQREQEALGIWREALGLASPDGLISQTIRSYLAGTDQ
ncbi:DNA-binding transcriptional activator of the SARP family [Lentzea albidocapillata subsp. violacea]|uniref:DNA-binding transcriptional activator of the SARP family n=1 Tax=Lentzea albidocapillata subsp. violacea TaxID=128104 RepID=A0A1G9NZA7_9PSEU|nr:tetratricopeptide repeat protein [Lentzea albidocapillata]SDL91888.1 DNA-binding transcriptional activator of the SARP family [Lentzea albidocapillata subsp. violacea]